MLLTQPQTPRSKEKICSFVMQQCLAIWLNYETAKVLSVRLFIFVCLFLTGVLLLLLDLSETIRLRTVNPGSELIWARLNVFSSWIGKKPVELVLEILSLVICAMWLAQSPTTKVKFEAHAPSCKKRSQYSKDNGVLLADGWGSAGLLLLTTQNTLSSKKKVKPAANHPGEVNNWWTNSRNAECKEYKWCFYKNFITASPWSFT